MVMGNGINNNVKDYIEDGTHSINTLSLGIGGTSVISSSRAIENVTNSITRDTNAEINSISEKSTPVNADLLLIEDSAASNAKKKVQIGNLQVLTKINPSPGIDHTFSGIWIEGTVGESVVIGDLLYLKASDSKYWKNDADAEATTKGQCVMATGTISADASGNLLKYGYIRDDTWTWTVGDDLYASATPGNPTSTAPSTTGQFVRIIGQAQSADIIFFNPDNTYIEVS